MFTGIVELAAVRSVRKTGRGYRLILALPSKSWQPKAGQSLAVNGACLTVASRNGRAVACEVVPETWRRTNFRSLRGGARVNVEQPMQLKDRLHGHFVLGHVDGTGRVVARGNHGDEIWMDVRVPPTMRRWLLPKGSIAVDGVSLTIARVRGTTVRVYLVPHTLRHSTLGRCQRGASVNLEGDYLLKWAALWMLPHRRNL